MSASTRHLSTDAYLAPGAGSDLSDAFGVIPTPTPGQVRAARLQVAAHAVDVGEARMLLAMCGLGEP